ncbi:phage minor tail protein, partial [Acetobacter persici]
MAQSVLTGRTTQGSISGILSLGTFEDMLAGVMTADWADITIVSTGVASDASSFMYQPDDNIGGNTGCWQISLTNSTAEALGIPKSGVLLLTDSNINAANLAIPYRAKGNSILVPIGSIPNTTKDDVAKSGASMRFDGITNGKIGKTFTFRKALSGKWEL